jgi:hypothetical protein
MPRGAIDEGNFMNPCAKNRKLLVWLVTGALEPRQAEALRDHLVRCEGCRQYRNEVMHVADRLAEAQPDSQAVPSATFYQRVARRLQPVGIGGIQQILCAWFRGLRVNWRLAIPAVVVLTMVVLAMGIPHSPRIPRPPVMPAPPGVSEASAGKNLETTIANYQRVAGQSLARFDDLLTRQGNQRLPEVPAWTLSSLALSSESF